MVEAKWPEHVRLMALRDERDHVQGFLDWLLDETPAILAVIDGDRRLAQMGANDVPLPFDPVNRHRGPLRQTLLAAYFDIDPGKLDDEKRQMLDELRAMHHDRGDT